MKKSTLYIRKGLVYALGQLFMALGVAFSAKSALGVSPVTCPAAVGQALSGLSLGVCTTILYFVYMGLQAVILGRQYTPKHLLQIIASFLFGFFVDLSVWIISPLSTPELYPLRLLYLLLSVPLVAVGVTLYLSTHILPTPGDGMSLAIAQRFSLSLPNAKTIFDVSAVAISAAVSLLTLGRLSGVREGTIICALLVGPVMKPVGRLLLPRLYALFGETAPAK